MKLIRRDFFRRLFVKMAAFGLLGKTGKLYFLAHAQENVGELADGCKYLNVSQARTLEAIADQIIPADDFPGGKEAGVLYFIDNALTGWRSEDRWDYVAGLEGVDESSQIVFGNKFSDLKSDQQIKVLETLERGEARGEIWRRFQVAEGREAGSSSQRFFSLVVRHTMQGYYADPKYGGNKDSKSWTMIGYVGAPRH